MTTYFVTLLIVWILCTNAEKYDYLQNDSSLAVSINHTGACRAYFMLASLLLILVSGLRHWVGTDYGSYYIGYMTWANRLANAIKTLDEPGYPLLARLSVRLGGDGTLAIFAASVITVGVAMRTIYKNTTALKKTVLLYLFLGCWSASFNAVRQCLAAAIVFAGYRSLKENKILKYIIFVSIAYLFHKSAIVTAVFFVFSKRKINLRSVIVLGIGSTVALYSYQILFGMAEDILNQTIEGYNYYYQAVNVLRVFVGVIPSAYFLISLWPEREDPDVAFHLNSLMLHAFINIITINSAYLARMTIFTAPFVALGLAELSDKVAQRKGRTLISIMLFLFFVFWSFELYNSGSLNPYHFIWQQL